MKLEKCIWGLGQLGSWFTNMRTDESEALVQSAVHQNNWFTRSNVMAAFKAWGQVLTQENIQKWTGSYQLNRDSAKRVGLIPAGNIPLVGLHDLLSVLISGHHAYIKYAAQDQPLMAAVTDKLKEIDKDFDKHIIEIEQLREVDAVIATGSDNSARYFKYYFSGYPHIIRQNRVSAAILNGRESTKDFENLTADLFQYFGLGCRNISKVFIPIVYPPAQFIDRIKGVENILTHHKYRNNYDYNKSIYLVNKTPHLDSGLFLMCESPELVSPISVVYYEYYENIAELTLKLSKYRDKIQCVVSKNGWYEGSIPFGTTQQPELWDYADGVDTLAFLSVL